MTGYYIRLCDLTNDEIGVLLNARHLRYRVSPKIAVARSATDTSAAARRRQTHYNRMD